MTYPNDLTGEDRREEAKYHNVCEFCGAPAVAVIEHEYGEIPGTVRALVCGHRRVLRHQPHHRGVRRRPRGRHRLGAPSGDDLPRGPQACRVRRVGLGRPPSRRHQLSVLMEE